jgi:hypothetical protein
MNISYIAYKMNYKDWVLVVLLSVAFRPFFLQAQESIPAAGGDATGSGGSVSYSIGQVVYSTNTSATGSVSEGVQQPYEIFVITGSDLLPLVSLSCKVFPNPTTDFLILSVGESEKRNLSYRLSDLNGRDIASGKVIDEQTRIQMGTLRNGNYFLSVLMNNSEVKTFKIIKN